MFSFFVCCVNVIVVYKIKIIQNRIHLNYYVILLELISFGTLTTNKLKKIVVYKVYIYNFPPGYRRQKIHHHRPHSPTTKQNKTE